MLIDVTLPHQASTSGSGSTLFSFLLLPTLVSTLMMPLLWSFDLSRLSRLRSHPVLSEQHKYSGNIKGEKYMLFWFNSTAKSASRELKPCLPVQMRSCQKKKKGASVYMHTFARHRLQLFPVHYHAALKVAELFVHVCAKSNSCWVIFFFFCHILTRRCWREERRAGWDCKVWRKTCCCKPRGVGCAIFQESSV